MSELFETIIAFFDQEEWPYVQLEERTVLQLAAQVHTDQWNCFAEAKEASGEFIFYSVCPVSVPEDKRAVMAEFLTRANYGLILGNFEMDWSDGEIRYKTSIDVDTDRLTPTLIQPLVYRNLRLMAKYLPGIKTILDSSQSPELILQQIEQ